MNKLLTIIVPVYNTENYVERCLNSINHPNINVIIVDDGSYDKSPEIIDKYCERYSNFKVIHTKNQGAAAARLTGLKLVKTEYFSFVDSDDIVNIDNYFNMVYQMKTNGFKIGNGRIIYHFSNCNMHINSRKWKKQVLDFSQDKLEFSNISCALWDKIWHIDYAPLFMFESKQKVYEDMEIVYYVIAKYGKIFHTNDLIYNYCKRNIKNNGTSAIELQMIRSNGLKGLIEASISMKNKFKYADLYQDFEDELNSIIIKLIYQRIFMILKHKQILNRKEMAELVFQIMSSLIPDWQNNKYLQIGFKGSEYNDYIFYIGTEILRKINNVSLEPFFSDYNYLLEEYDKKIILKK